MTSLAAQWASGVGELHSVLAVILFYLINIIGQRSMTLGYTSVSMYMQRETSPAFNFVLRVISPTVYIIVVASILYALGLDAFVKNLHYTVFYYVLFRLFYNILLGQPRLINWKRQVIYSALMMSLSYFAYDKLITSKKNLLPDFSNLANELWIIIIIFIYNLVNDMDSSDDDTDKRKVNYIEFMYKKFSRKYASIVNVKVEDKIVKLIIYSIMIHENYNRPVSARKLENLLFFLTGKPRTFGIMQVYFKVPVTDEQSVRLGAKRIRKSYESVCQAITERDENGSIPAYYLRDAIMQVIGSYNTGEQYTREVYEILEGLAIRHDKELARRFVIE